MDVGNEAVCWICLEEEGSGNGLLSPCNCPRKVHPTCLARWQLRQVGRTEETHCRFCNASLTDWKASLTPERLKSEVGKARPVMNVFFEGVVHKFGREFPERSGAVHHNRIPVECGGDVGEFTGRVRELFNLPEHVEIHLSFGCKEPGLSGQFLKLEGNSAFDAAVYCAALSAASRLETVKDTSVVHSIRPAAGEGSSSSGGAGDSLTPTAGSSLMSEGMPVLMPDILLPASDSMRHTAAPSPDMLEPSLGSEPLPATTERMGPAVAASSGQTLAPSLATGKPKGKKQEAAKKGEGGKRKYSAKRTKHNKKCK